MFLVTGITGKVGGATARHLLAQGKTGPRTGPRPREGGELDGPGRRTGRRRLERCGRHRASAQGRRRRVCHVADCLGPLAGFQGSQGRDRELCRGAHQSAAATRRRALVDGGEQNQRAGDDHGPVASGARLSRPGIANRLRARRRVLRKLPLRPARRPGRHAARLLQSDQSEIDHGRDQRHRRRGRNASERAGLVGASDHRTRFDGQRG